jgi:hypothetical protein
MCDIDAFILMSQQKSMECVTGIHSQKKQLNRQIGEVVVHSMKVSLKTFTKEPQKEVIVF